MFGLQRNHCQPRVFCEREVVVIFCAYFSMEVAREVTHPLWPSRVPFKISCSVILAVLTFRWS